MIPVQAILVAGLGGAEILSRARVLHGTPAVIPLIGCLALLSTPALLSLQKGRFSLFSAEVLLPFAFYLSAVHSPLTRVLFTHREFDVTELRVVEISVYACF